MKRLFLVVKRTIPFPTGSCRWRGMVAWAAGLVLFLVFPESPMAGLFGPSLPKGKKVEDPYLVQLFEPEFPYESIKVIETEEGKRYVVIKAKRSIEDSTWRDYRFKTLATRNIVEFGWGSEFTKTLLRSELTIYRFPSERPYVVEYSQIEGEPLSDKPWGPVEDVLRLDGRYMVVLVSREFGRVFRRFVLYPEEDAGCPDPPFVGRYPNSRNLACFAEGDKIFYFYVTPDPKQAVIEYYKPLLKAHYDSVGFCHSEFEMDGTSPVEEYGLSHGYKRLTEIAELLRDKAGGRLDSAVISSQEMILGIRVADIISVEAMRHHCLITVRVGFDKKFVAELVRNRKRYCKDSKR
jgi:hypothetical protein